VKLRIFITPKLFTPAFAMQTSRGMVHQKKSYYVLLQAGADIGVGEGAPLPGLSKDGDTEWLRFISYLLQEPTLPDPTALGAYTWAQTTASQAGVPVASSIIFALESAVLSLINGQPEVYYPGTFTGGSMGIPINGLVWMDDLVAMRHQAEEKVQAGFTTIKFKIGAKTWADELALLKDFRKGHSPDEIIVRVDANGAFTEDKAMRVMDALQGLCVHSIEQPIAAGNAGALRRLAREGATPMALDEEFITPMPDDERDDMLAYVGAPFWVLKPTLIGGLGTTEHLIELAHKQGARWWLTSSLESGIALTAIAQLAASHNPTLPQGLSTGKIYLEPVQHPNKLESASLFFDQAAGFDIAWLKQPDPRLVGAQ